jgi:hypothetical protein
LWLAAPDSLPAKEGVRPEPPARAAVRPRCDLVSPWSATSRENKPLICSGFCKPSDGLEPSTPSLPWSDEAGTAGKAGKPRARKPRKKRESADDE